MSVPFRRVSAIPLHKGVPIQMQEMAGMNVLDDWFASRGWTPFAFQREVPVEDARVLAARCQARKHGLALLRRERPARAVELHGLRRAGTGFGVDGGKGAAATGRRKGQRH